MEIYKAKLNLYNLHKRFRRILLHTKRFEFRGPQRITPKDLQKIEKYLLETSPMKIECLKPTISRNNDVNVYIWQYDNKFLISFTCSYYKNNSNYVQPKILSLDDNRPLLIINI